MYQENEDIRRKCQCCSLFTSIHSDVLVQCTSFLCGYICNVHSPGVMELSIAVQFNGVSVIRLHFIFSFNMNLS